jgi:hypothetical protein
MGLTIGGDVEGLRILAGRQDASELACGEIDDADAVGGAICRRQRRLVDPRRRNGRAGQGDEQLLSVGRQMSTPWPLAHRDAGDDGAACRIDDNHVAASRQ